jgi:hypothetical protein
MHGPPLAAHQSAQRGIPLGGTIALQNRFGRNVQVQGAPLWLGLALRAATAFAG